MRYLLLIPFLFSQVMAKSFIEGGSSVSAFSMDYLDIVKIENSSYGSCTGTKVSSTLVITAGHCVVSISSHGLVDKLIRPGHLLGMMGEVTAVHVHPKYLDAVKRKNERKDQVSRKLVTLYDVAFIEVKERPSKRTDPYPKIISETNKPKERKNFELVGYGGKQAGWDGNAFFSSPATNVLQSGENEWLNCPVDFFKTSLTEIDKLTNSVNELLMIEASRIHEISDDEETIVTDGKAMILAGDSGSPSLEKDESGKSIITGIASNIIYYGEGSGEPGLVVFQDDNIVAVKELEKMPENWGLNTKPSTSFSEVNDVLKSQGLLDSEGKPKPGVKIKRYYTRNTKGHYADLSHPENQKFIKSIMK